VRAGVTRSGGFTVSGLQLEHPDLIALPVPSTVPVDRYFLYRRR